jgi:asparagine synthase (glutamine-hydrolysing)
MCGIAGIISETSDIRSVIEQMTTALVHRGPDANSFAIDPSRRFAVGHTRLSIIDLSEQANQPFFSKDRRYIIVFNGEIYNFRELRDELIANHGIQFTTSSDTEVIIEAFAIWKEKMVLRLEGMFAIAIVDQKDSKLYLFRDRAGKKPLFYFEGNGLFAFASEIKSLLKHPQVKQAAKINKAVVSTFLHLGYIPEPATIYTTIFKFPAGHWGEIGVRSALEKKPYWRIQDAIGGKKITSPAEAKKQLAALLDRAVKERMISDVPLGAFLSGGTDSSLVTAFAAKHATSPLQTFSIGFTNSKFDESKFAREVASRLHTEHTDYILEEKEAVDILETYLNHFDEPFGDTSAIPTMLVSKLARQKVTVALTGDGGDELFQGYGAYAWANRLNNKSSLIKLAQPLLRNSGNSRLMRIADLVESPNYGSSFSHIFSQEQYLFSQQEICDKLLADPGDFKVFSYADTGMDGELNAGERQALFDFQYYLKDDLLVKVDRASMYYALECRSPLLDHHLVEFAFSLSYDLKVHKGVSKWLLKELLRDYLPNHLVDRKKWGFSVPLADWLRKDLRYLREEYLNERVTAAVGLFQFRYLQQLEREFLAGREYLYHRLWLCIVLHKWLIEHQ